MVLTALFVSPVTVRPSITLESGDRSEDDLTHKLVDVLRINQRLRENRDAGAPQLIVEDLWELLQYHVTTYFDNQTSGIPPARHRSGRPLKTLVQRLKGKEGRFRSNLSGKRVNFSARTVISPDPVLSINEVGVPVEAARELTVPIHVQSYNHDIVKEWVKRGPTPAAPVGEFYIPGVNYVIRSDGRRIRVTDKNAEAVSETVEIGYVVERQLVDGDIVLFNRQPSLHRMSMMGHEVRVMPHKTFRFNLAVCPPYNADFDGDEMNLHVLRARLLALEDVEIHLIAVEVPGPHAGPGAHPVPAVRRARDRGDPRPHHGVVPPHAQGEQVHPRGGHLHPQQDRHPGPSPAGRQEGRQGVLVWEGLVLRDPAEELEHDVQVVDRSEGRHRPQGAQGGGFPRRDQGRCD